MSGVFTYREYGRSPNFVVLWGTEFVNVYTVVFQAVVIIGPIAKFIQTKIVEKYIGIGKINLNILLTNNGLVNTITFMNEKDYQRRYDVNESFPMVIAECEKHMRESLNARFRDAGYSSTVEQWIILVHLNQQDGISQQELANRYNRSKVSALNLIKKLKQDQFVVRKTDPNDARVKLIFLTGKGHRLLQELIPIAKTNKKAMTQGISEEEITILKNVLRKITGNLLA